MSELCFHLRDGLSRSMKLADSILCLIRFLRSIHFKSTEHFDQAATWAILNPSLAAKVEVVTVKLNNPWIDSDVDIGDLEILSNNPFLLIFQSNDHPPAIDVFPNARVSVSK